jgi:hypothetical protein
MKIKMTVVAAVLAAFISTCRADLIYLEDFGMVAERNYLMISFSGPPDYDGKITMEVKFGEGISGKVSKFKITQIRDTEKARSAIEKLLKTLNDPKNVVINISDAMKQAGWSF